MKSMKDFSGTVTLFEDLSPLTYIFRIKVWDSDPYLGLLFVKSKDYYCFIED